MNRPQKSDLLAIVFLAGFVVLALGALIRIRG